MQSSPVIKEVLMEVPVQKVWDAITINDKMKHWYFDLAEFKAEVGFEFQFYGGDEENQYLHLCKITEVVPLKKLAYTWQYENMDVVTVVTFELFPEENNKTLVRLTHEGVDQFPTNLKNFRRESFMEGWNAIIGTMLKDYVEKN